MLIWLASSACLASYIIFFFKSALQAGVVLKCALVKSLVIRVRTIFKVGSRA